jgi:putative ABC transport system substrate-binding protein
VDKKEATIMRLRIVELIFTFILVLGLLAAPLPTDAQKPGKVYRIGWLTAKKSDVVKKSSWFKAFMEELRDLGWVEGTNFVLEFRSAEANFARLPALAAELVRLKVDVIITLHTTDTHAAKNATTSIPIVFTIVSDPLGEGFIKSHARPGGNLTGTNPDYMEIMGKVLQLLTEAVPEVSRVAYLWNPGYGQVALRALKKMQAAAKTLEMKIQSVEVRNPQDIEPAFSAMTMEHADALFVLPGPLTNSNSKRIADLALRHRLPLANNGGRVWAARGALFGYAPSILPLFPRAAHYVDRILKGANPADLPVEKPTHYDFVINLKTAKALGITIPQSLLIQATDVIE